MSSSPLLELKNLSCHKDKGQPIFSDVNLVVNEGDVMVLQGKSGSGKSTLLKCISHMNIYEGEVLYRGQTPQSYGIPSFRTRVMYVPQRASLLPGTPRDFLATLSTFSVHRAKARCSSPAPAPASSKAASTFAGMLGLKHDEPDVSGHDAIALAEAWGIERDLWDRTWANLSGGEAQRIVLAIAVGTATAEVLLLDEPTSALDSDASSTVEKHLVGAVQSPDSDLKAIVWITHSPEQGERVGTRFIRIASGDVREGSGAPDV